MGKKIFLLFLGIIIIFTLLVYVGKEYILNRIKFTLIKKIELSTKYGLKIQGIGYTPARGFILKNISVYRSPSYKDEMINIYYLSLNFSILSLIKEKIFSPSIIIKGCNFKTVRVDGYTELSVDLLEKIKNLQDLLDAIKKVEFRNFSIKNNFLYIENLRGSIKTGVNSINSENIRFSVDGEDYILGFRLLEITENPVLTLQLSSSLFNVSLDMIKEDEIFKIKKLSGDILNSTFSFMGELKNLHNPSLSLYGRLTFNTKDSLKILKRFWPEKEFYKNLPSIDGKLTNSIYLNGMLKNMDKIEIGIKSESDNMKISMFELKDFRMNTKIKGGTIDILYIEANPYGGTFRSSARIDYAEKGLPFWIESDLNNINLNSFFRKTKLKNRNIKGSLFCKTTLHGELKNTNSIEGGGAIFIRDANLGPMPILTPLLGNIYGYFQNTIPGLKKIEITKGSCDFQIVNRKIITENLVLWGGIVNIYARGYIDFDKNLNFEVENEFVEPAKEEETSWQTSLQEMIIKFGKLFSKAHLTGTLEKPKWKFQYLGGFENMLKKGFDRIFKEIF